MELSDIESFDFFFDCLWKPATAEAPERYKGNVVDTIVFRNGKPTKWLFTSEKTGVSDCDWT